MGRFPTFLTKPRGGKRALNKGPRDRHVFRGHLQDSEDPASHCSGASRTSPVRPGSLRVGTVLRSRVSGTGAPKAVSVDSSLLDNTLVGLSSVSADLCFGTRPPPVYLRRVGGGCFLRPSANTGGSLLSKPCLAVPKPTEPRPDPCKPKRFGSQSFGSGSEELEAQRFPLVDLSSGRLELG